MQGDKKSSHGMDSNAMWVVHTYDACIACVRTYNSSKRTLLTCVCIYTFFPRVSNGFGVVIGFVFCVAGVWCKPMDFVDSSNRPSSYEHASARSLLFYLRPHARHIFWRVAAVGGSWEKCARDVGPQIFPVERTKPVTRVLTTLGRETERSPCPAAFWLASF